MEINERYPAAKCRPHNAALPALSFTAAVNQYGTVAAGSVAGSGTGIKGGQLTFMGVPVLTVDQILATESQVS